MAVPTGGNGDVTIRVSTNGSPTVRQDTVPDHVVSMLFGTDLEEWRRSWGGPSDRTPEREVVVVASDISRGATTTAPSGRIRPDRGLAYTVVGPNVQTSRLAETVSEALTEFDSTGSQVIVDDLGPLATRESAERAGEIGRELASVTAEAGGSITVGYSLTPETAPALASFSGVANRITGTDPETAEEVNWLRRDDPTTFGYVRRNWAEAQRGIEACTRNYPQAKQVHASLANPETTPRTLGATLSGLVTLRVLDTWGDTVGPTRYDLTEYDPVRMASVGVAFAGATDDGVNDRSG